MATLLLCTAWREIQRQRVLVTFDSIRVKSNPNSFTVSLFREYNYYPFVRRVVVFMKDTTKYIKIIQKHFRRLIYSR